MFWVQYKKIILLRRILQYFFIVSSCILAPYRPKNTFVRKPTAVTLSSSILTSVKKEERDILLPISPSFYTCSGSPIILSLQFFFSLWGWATPISPPPLNAPLQGPTTCFPNNRIIINVVFYIQLGPSRKKD